MVFFTHYYIFLRKHFLCFSIILTTFATAIRQAWLLSRLYHGLASVSFPSVAVAQLQSLDL